MAKPEISWDGVLPAVTTQFNDDFSINFDSTERVINNLIRDGISGLIMSGTVGEGCSLNAAEKRQIVALAVECSGGKVPVIVGVAEYTTALACELASDCEKLGADGLMVLPAMVYKPKPHELFAHFESVAGASALPIMIYNNPPSYNVDVTPDMAIELAKINTVVCIKDSSGVPNRFVDMANAVGDDLQLFCGLDDVVIECMALGARGWISGMSNVFPKEGQKLYELCRDGKFKEALKIYKWFMPLLHLDADPDLVQCIKLCEQIAGRGSELTRPPRLPLQGERRAYVEKIMADALANRPKL
jgi:4-hydroxy-tetrahydrodipicolinate synthase